MLQVWKALNRHYAWSARTYRVCQKWPHSLRSAKAEVWSVKSKEATIPTRHVYQVESDKMDDDDVCYLFVVRSEHSRVEVTVVSMEIYQGFHSCDNVKPSLESCGLGGALKRPQRSH